VEVLGRERADRPISRFEAPQPEERIIHAIGIYESGAGHGKYAAAGAEVRVEIDRQPGREIFLALSAYQPVRWRLTGPGAAAVRGIYLAGYHRQQVSGAPQAQVIDRSAEFERAEENGGAMAEDAAPDTTDGKPHYVPVPCTITYADADAGGCPPAEQFLTNARLLLNAPVASFTGVYQADAFRIHAMPRE
jgi:hypothetical protein